MTDLETLLSRRYVDYLGLLPVPLKFCPLLITGHDLRAAKAREARG